MASALAFRVSPSFPRNFGYNSGFRGKFMCNSGGEESTVVYSDRVSVNGASVVTENAKIESEIGGGNGHLGSIVGAKRKGKELSPVKLEVLWDDGYGSESMRDYLDISREMIKPDGGPPRWFCPVECGRPLEDSPLLLFLPGNFHLMLLLCYLLELMIFGSRL